MNVQIHSKDFKLGEHTKAHVEAAIESFNKYNMDITTVNTHITREKKGFAVEFDIHVAHNKPVVINQTDDDMDAAIDMAVERANKALRRLHDKSTSHRGEGIKGIEVQE